MSKIRVLLADDHAIMRIGLSALINGEPDMEVIGNAGTGNEAVRLAIERKADVVLMDLMMPELSGADATALLHRQRPETRILVLTSFGDSSELVAAIRNGASGVILKDTDTDDLLASIRAVHDGKAILPDGLLPDQTGEPSLTERQKEILTSVTKGFSNPEIARQFHISVIGVKKHLQAIFVKLGASSRSEAVAIALRKHLLKI